MAGPAESFDRRGVIAESYRIEGIGAADCRSIFLDWTLGLPDDAAPSEAAAALLGHYRPPEDHPMTALLREAAEGMPGTGRRRGGAMGRQRG